MPGYLVKSLIKEEKLRDAHSLLLVSRSVRAIVEPHLYRKIKQPSDSRVRLLCRAMLGRPELARYVKEISLEEEEESTWSDDDIDEDEDEDEDNGSDSSSKSDAAASSDKPRPTSEVTNAQATADFLKNQFSTNGERIRSLEKSWITRLNSSDGDVMKWILLCQLSNLSSLTLTAHSAQFGQMGIILRLPHLEDLSFIVDVGNEGRYKGEVPPEEVLESIISGTKRLKYLTFEDMRSITEPVIHDARKLKRILDTHVAETLEYLSVVLGINDEKDWRMSQECTDIAGLLDL